MDKQRKNFKCIFNPHVTEYNKEAIILSLINQFEGYYADPEVTQIDNGFILTVSIGDNLHASTVRDKILWNQFIEHVTVADSIRKMQIIRLPKASQDNEGTVGAFGPHGSDSGVDEKLYVEKPEGHKDPQYTIGPNTDGSLGWHASVHYADPTGQMLPTVYGPGAEEGKPVDEDVKSDITEMHQSTPKVLGVSAFRRVAIDTDVGSAFTLNKPNGFQSVNDTPTQPLHGKAAPATGIGGGAPISGASWYVTQPGNEQGTDLGTERVKDNASSAPLGIAASVLDPKLDEEDSEQGIKGPYKATLDVIGVGEHPIGGASYGSMFGINEYYDYEGNVDDYDI